MPQKLTDKQVSQIRETIARIERVSGLLLSDGHPEVDKIAKSWATSVGQLRELLSSNPNPGLCCGVRAGLNEGLRDLPKILKSIHGADHERLIRLIAEI